MIVETGILGVLTLCILIPLLKIKLKCVKKVGICKANLSAYAGTGGCKGAFEYEMEGITYVYVEKRGHFGSFKEGKEYIIYVNRDNHIEFYSKKAVNDLRFFVIFAMIMILLSIIEYSL